MRIYINTLIATQLIIILVVCGCTRHESTKGDEKRATASPSHDNIAVLSAVFASIRHEYSSKHTVTLAKDSFSPSCVYMGKDTSGKTICLLQICGLLSNESLEILGDQAFDDLVAKNIDPSDWTLFLAGSNVINPTPVSQNMNSHINADLLVHISLPGFSTDSHAAICYSRVHNDGGLDVLNAYILRRRDDGMWSIVESHVFAFF